MTTLPGAVTSPADLRRVERVLFSYAEDRASTPDRMIGARPTQRMAIGRRNLLAFTGVFIVMHSSQIITARRVQPATAPTTLLSAPLELTGEWDRSWAQAAALVIARVRDVSLGGVRLVSDQQPERLRIEEHSSGPPAIWLHEDPPKTAWIIVDIGARAWSQLAYQFGHELGHVLCNSWGPQAKPRAPSQLIEEAFAEAFSIRGLALLAASWEQDPPFAVDTPYAKRIREYRANLIEKYKKAPTPDGDIGIWFQTNRVSLEHDQSTREAEGPAVLAILAALEDDKGCVEDLGAVNRLPARSGVPVEEYLALWEQSCAELGASGRLPAQLRRLLQLG